MNETANLNDLVQSRIGEFISSRESILAQVGSGLDPFASFSREFLSGGKRFRARFCYWGWQSVADSAAVGDSDGRASVSDVVSAASALEIFHAAALIHDDIIDNSDTRRGAPSAHRRFERLHRDGGWAGDAAEYGRAAATLLGDLLLGWSDELLDDALDGCSRPVARSARAEFNRMRTEVTAGQYLDILEERAWRSQDDSSQLSRAQQVLIYKSAKYSIESPLALGGLLAGATPAQLSSLRAFGLPLGVAFQLRDDLLGVFGDAAVTGKPSGDDLREGKRTVLIARTRASIPAPARNILDELLGDPDLNDSQIASLQATIRESGAVDDVEAMIDSNVARAIAALDAAPLSATATGQLRELADAVTRRTY
ncbi:polyprenyl synthetase family protein [Mycetocola zhujimingii]|uniref:polyprenyl synthetase family protein n=1 Tax=Mycetocola zhujimingii TaxID=2079792 RepID=UPI000D3BAEEE|nr:polyprenyl synthetase family protein [Mycetocola zhujimingii]AWB86281.1 geranylgeranyl pyrophosphate synthase [Mycetocola zhujimingii]